MLFFLFVHAVKLIPNFSIPKLHEKNVYLFDDKLQFQTCGVNYILQVISRHHYQQLGAISAYTKDKCKVYFSKRWLTRCLIHSFVRSRVGIKLVRYISNMTNRQAHACCWIDDGSSSRSISISRDNTDIIYLVRYKKQQLAYINWLLPDQRFCAG